MIFEKGIIKTPDFEYNEGCGGIGKALFQACKRFEERVALINVVTEEYDTYKTLLQKSISTALSLQERGFKKEELVALCSNKGTTNANVPIIAAQFLGCISFSIDPLFSVEESVELLQQVSPKIVFVTAEAKNLIAATLEKLQLTNTEVIVFGEQFEKEFLHHQYSECRFEPVHIQELSDICMIHFSSGTTATPKAICLNHYYFMPILSNINTLVGSISPQNNTSNGHPLGVVGLRYTNWYWVSSSSELIIMILVGGCRLLRDTFNPQEFWYYVDKHHVSDSFLMPLQCIELSESPKPSWVDTSELRTIMTGTYSLHKDYIQALKELLPNTVICQIYATTEGGVATMFRPTIPEHRQLLSLKPTSCGLPISGLSYKILDMETGNKCGPNQPGELCLKGKHIFSGFYNKDSSACFDSEGFFKTGDLVYFDEDFCFYVLDRIKKVLRWSDRFIYLYHIEKVILSHPAVRNAVVIGVPHKREGERLLGVVELKSGFHGVTEEELVKHVDGLVDDHKRLRGGVKILEHLPTTANGKVSILKLKGMFKDSVFDQ